MNHRRVQRALFSMLHDEHFASALRRGEDWAREGLSEDEWRLLAAADPAAITADRDGRRRTQAMGNVLKEFLLSASAADAAGRALGAGFLSSRGFHRAVREDGSIPLAFLAFAEEQAREWGDDGVTTLLAVEGALARERRARRARPTPGPREIVLAPEAGTAVVPAGAAAFAESWRARLDGAELVPSPRPAGEETLLIVTRPTAGGFGAPEVTVETLGELAAPLFRLAREPVGPQGRRRYAEERGATLDELDAFLDDFVTEGVLLRG
ncbi:MAG: hypothetical protein R3F20_14960 [Planctomycetota bacterium]